MSYLINSSWKKGEPVEIILQIFTWQYSIKTNIIYKFGTIDCMWVSRNGVKRQMFITLRIPYLYKVTESFVFYCKETVNNLYETYWDTWTRGEAARGWRHPWPGPEQRSVDFLRSALACAPTRQTKPGGSCR